MDLQEEDLTAPKDSRLNRIGEIFRTAGLPMCLALIRHGDKHRTVRMQEVAMELGFTVYRCRTAMSKLSKLGLFVKSNTTARDVVYDLTKEGFVMARCIDNLLEVFGSKGGDTDG